MGAVVPRVQNLKLKLHTKCLTCHGRLTTFGISVKLGLLLGWIFSPFKPLFLIPELLPACTNAFSKNYS